MSTVFTKTLIKRHRTSKRFRFTPALFAGTVIFFFSLSNLFALNVPPMRGAVNDYAKMLETRDVQTLETYLEKLNRDTGIQIAVLTVPSLEGESIDAFSIRTVESWKLGQEGKDNGALLLIAAAEKKIRIEVGYGLEGILTDMQCGLIIRNLIAPHFKNGDYGKGITAAVQHMAQNVTFGEAAAIDENLSAAEDDRENGSLLSVVVLLIFFMIMMSGMNRRGRYSGGSGLWRAATAASVLSSLSRSSRHSSGGFGGGFSGGGGGFGGGGASGGW